jgi:hypothetical protein
LFGLGGVIAVVCNRTFFCVGFYTVDVCLDRHDVNHGNTLRWKDPPVHSNHLLPGEQRCQCVEVRCSNSQPSSMKRFSTLTPLLRVSALQDYSVSEAIA